MLRKSPLHVEEIAASHNEASKPVERSALRVVVRQTEYVNEIKAHLGSSGDPIAEPVCGDLWTIGVVDQPTTIRVLKPSDLTALDLSPDEILALAKQNTKAALGDRVPSGKDAGKDSIGVLVGDSYTASLFAFPEIWAPLAHALGGLIATVPSTDRLLFTADYGPDAVVTLQKVANVDFNTAMRPLSHVVCRWTEKGWVEIPTAQQ